MRPKVNLFNPDHFGCRQRRAGSCDAVIAMAGRWRGGGTVPDTRVCQWDPASEGVVLAAVIGLTMTCASSGLAC